MTELPSGWSLASVGEVGEVRLGRQRSPDKANGPHMRPYMRAANVTWKGLSLEDVKEMDFSPEEFTLFELKPGDVLVGEASGTKLEVGKSAIWKGQIAGACFQNTLIRVRPGEAVLPEYLQKHLAHDALRGALAETAKGVGIYHLSAGGFTTWQIAVAPIGEQKRIVDKLEILLGHVAACEERLDRTIAILERLRQSVLAAATGGELTREWRETQGIDDEWRHVPLGSLLLDLRYGTAKKCAYEPRQTPVLRIPNIAQGTIDHSDLKYAKFDEQERRKLALAAGDLLMIRSNGSVGLVGRTALVSTREEGYLFAGYLIRLRPNLEQVRPAYLSLFLESPASRTRIEQTARSTTGVNNINGEEIRGFPVDLPTVAEQDEVVRRVEILLRIASRIEERVELGRRYLGQAMPSTLSKAFHGNLVAQDPNDEPASNLLARVRDRPAPPKQPRVRRKAAGGEVETMTKRLIEVLAEAKTWIAAHEAFRSCGVGNGSETSDLETLYAELRDLVRSGRVEVQPVRDSQGRKIHDRLKFIAGT